MCASLSLELSAQGRRTNKNWQRTRTQITGGLGVSNFLGELGGRNTVGSDFVFDLEVKQFKPVASVGIRHFVKSNVALRGQFSYGTLAGDDALTTERYRSNRNLHFKSSLLELSAVVEFYFGYVKPGHRYDMRGVSGLGAKGADFYGFIGLGGIKFNPQAKLGDEWIDLKPLSTEGQGLRNGPEEYSLTSLIIPLGIGYRKKMSRTFYVGIELGHRITFTDYIDDVSTSYYDNDQLLANGGLEAAFFADPSLGYFVDPETGLQVSENVGATGAQRGDPLDNDAYLFAQFTASYLLKSAPNKRRRSSSLSRRKATF